MRRTSLVLGGEQDSRGFRAAQVLTVSCEHGMLLQVLSDLDDLGAG